MYIFINVFQIELVWTEFKGEGIKQHSEHQISESRSTGKRVGRFVGALRRIREFWGELQCDGDSNDNSDSDLRQGTETYSHGGVPTFKSSTAFSWGQNEA